jgi:5-methylcytosine-specific restriction endonuclease McrA
MSEIKTCEVCAVQFNRRVRSTRLCSDRCRLIDSRLKSRASSVKRDTRNRLPRPCRECDKTFTPEYGNKRRTFCSAECSKRNDSRITRSARRAKIRAVDHEPIDPLQVMARDGWRCHICGTSTPRRLRGTLNDRAPQLDHILPLAEGGTHTLDNVACACRNCNRIKGSRPLGQMRIPLVRAASLSTENSLLTVRRPNLKIGEIESTR